MTRPPLSEASESVTRHALLMVRVRMGGSDMNQLAKYAMKSPLHSLGKGGCNKWSCAHPIHAIGVTIGAGEINHTSQRKHLWQEESNVVSAIKYSKHVHV